MGFVVEKVPFGGEIMFFWSDPIVRVGEGFGAGSEKRVFFPKVDCSFPNDKTNVFRTGDV